MARRKVSYLENLIEQYLEPVLQFCGLYIDENGLLVNGTTHVPYRNFDDEKLYVVIKNYEIYEKFIQNKDDYIPFNPFVNTRQCTIMMKFLRNAIFQIDSEFDDFFYDVVTNKETGEIYKEEIDISENEIFEESEKHILMIKIPPDYKNNVRIRWIIHTNLMNQIIDKPIVDLAVPKDISINIAIILSFKLVVDYYDKYNQRLIQYDATNDIVNIQEMMKKVSKDNVLNKKKFSEFIQEQMNDATNYSLNVDKNEGSEDNVVLPIDLNCNYNIN